MPATQLNSTIALSSTTENVLTGDLLELPEEPLVYQCGFCQSATGLLLDVFVGSNAIASSFVPLIKTTAPLFPDDFTVEFGVLPGQRVKIRARNTTAGNLTLLTSIKATPVSL